MDEKAGKAAETCLRVLEGFGDYALLEAIPHTGRRHQIRAHLRAIGFPLAVDSLYGDGVPICRRSRSAGAREPGGALLERLGLHACSLEILHPGSGEAARFEAPYPPDIAGALQALRRRSRSRREQPALADGGREGLARPGRAAA